MAVEGRVFTEEEKREEVSMDTLDRSFHLRESMPELTTVRDLVELDAVGRERTAVLVDPETGKLKKAYLHLPARRTRWTRLLYNSLDLMKRGFRLPGEVPVEETIHLYPGHYKLGLSEMKQYPVVLLSWIGVTSVEVLAQYLVMGGFVMGAYLPSLQEHLSQTGERAEIVKIELGHPLFHAFFDVTEYRERNKVCPPVEPLNALQLHNRLAAISHVPSFNLELPCYSNRLYVNAIVFGLIQQSRMGGRYLSGKKE